MSKLEGWAIRQFGPGAIISVIEKENPEAVADDIFDLVSKRIDAQFTDEKGDKIGKVAHPWLKSCFERILMRLDEDNKNIVTSPHN